MALHVGMLVTAAIGLVAAIVGLKRSWRSDWGVATIASISLFLLGAIGGLDQLRSGDINSWELNILAFIPSSLSLAIGIVIFQKSEAQKITHLVNDGIYSISIIFLSSFLYSSQYKLRANTTLLAKANARLDHLSHHDQLTGLPNRRGFKSLFSRELSRCRRDGDGLYIAICDIDSFKQLNDREGHPAGDKVLRVIATILRESLRPTDAVARWGGEEFLILLHGKAENGVAEALERIRCAIAGRAIDWNGCRLNCTLSFGFTELHLDSAAPLGDAYPRADAALYKSKVEGKNTIRKG